MPLPAAERQRRFRKRQRRGVAVYRIEADDAVLLELLRTERLTDDEALDRERVEQESRRWSANGLRAGGKYSAERCRFP